MKLTKTSSRMVSLTEEDIQEAVAHWINLSYPEARAFWTEIIVDYDPSMDGTLFCNYTWETEK